MHLYKSTIVIWSDYDPSARAMELEEIARQAVSGDAYCSKMDCEIVSDPQNDSDWDGNEFFGEDD